MSEQATIVENIHAQQATMEAAVVRAGMLADAGDASGVFLEMEKAVMALLAVVDTGTNALAFAIRERDAARAEAAKLRACLPQCEVIE